MTLVVDQIVAGYPGAPVLRGVSLRSEPGTLVTVLGPSGSGKTTLLRVIAGLHRPDAGRVEVAGAEVTRLPPQRRRIGLVPQEGALFPHRTVAANIAYGLGSGAGRSERVTELLELIGLTERAQSMPHELSGGQRQRVALARALAPRPGALLLDEPFSSLDAALRERLREETAAMVRREGIPTVLITHDVDEALGLSDEVVVLDDGRVLASGTPEALHRTPPDLDIAARLGPATFVGGLCDGAQATTALGALSLLDPLPEGAVTVVLRPDDLRLDPDSSVRGTVDRVTFRAGRRIAIITGIDGLDDLPVPIPLDESPDLGQDVGVSVRGAVHALVKV